MALIAVMMALSDLVACGVAEWEHHPRRGAALGASAQSPIFPYAADVEWGRSGHCGFGQPRGFLPVDARLPLFFLLRMQYGHALQILRKANQRPFTRDFLQAAQAATQSQRCD